MVQSKTALRERTKSFALRTVRMFSTLPKIRKRRFSGNRCCAEVLRVVQTIGRRSVVEAKLNCLRAIEETAGSSCSWRRISFLQGSSRLSVTKSMS